MRRKIILVVGGSSGRGLSLVNLLHENNAAVYVISRIRSDVLPEGVKYLQADVTGTHDTISEFLPDQLHGLVYSVVA